MAEPGQPKTKYVPAPHRSRDSGPKHVLSLNRVMDADHAANPRPSEAVKNMRKLNLLACAFAAVVIAVACLFLLLFKYSASQLEVGTSQHGHSGPELASASATSVRHSD